MIPWPVVSALRDVDLAFPGRVVALLERRIRFGQSRKQPSTAAGNSLWEKKAERFAGTSVTKKWTVGWQAGCYY